MYISKEALNPRYYQCHMVFIITGVYCNTLVVYNNKFDSLPAAPAANHMISYVMGAVDLVVIYYSRNVRLNYTTARPCKNLMISFCGMFRHHKGRCAQAGRRREKFQFCRDSTHTEKKLLTPLTWVSPKQT